MTEEYKEVIAIDPGYATGVAAGRFSETSPLELIDAAVVIYEDWQAAWEVFRFSEVDYTVAEKFELISGNDFTADLTGVKVEGTLELLYGDSIVWRPRTAKNQVPDELLKDIGWWKTGKDVNWEDGRDANDAIIHLLGFVAFDLRHRPTLDAYFRGGI